MTSGRVLAVAACLVVGVVGVVGGAGVAGTAAASTTLVEVDPGNGATLDRAPSEAVLIFATELDAARALATVTVPGQRSRDVRPEVDGARMVVPVPSAGDGDYVVGYTAAAADGGPDAEVVSGEVGFAVTPDGVAPDTGGTAPWALGALAAVGLGIVVVVRAVRGVRGRP